MKKNRFSALLSNSIQFILPVLFIGLLVVLLGCPTEAPKAKDKSGDSGDGGGGGTSIQFKGKTYDILTSPDTGRVWLDRNLGASQVCTSSTDSACVGDYYQWGRGADGHELAGSGTTTTQATSITPMHSNFILNDTATWTNADTELSPARIAAWKDGGVNDICPAGFSVPTKDEIETDTINATGTNKITSTATGFTSFLKLSTTGYRHGKDEIQKDSTHIILWSRNKDDVLNATALRVIGSILASSAIYGTGHGINVRCIKDI